MARDALGPFDSVNKFSLRRMTIEMRRTAIHSFEDPSHIGGQIVHSYAVERAATLSSTAHVNGDGLQPSGSEHARQIVKITGAAAGIREQHHRSAGPIKGAFERRAAYFDVSVLLQSHLRVYPRSARAFLWSRVLFPASWLVLGA